MRFLLRNSLLKSLSPVIVFSFLVGCSMIKSTSSSGPTTQKEEYKGPKARVVVTKFIDKSSRGKTSIQTEDKMAEMLGNTLLATNRFIVQMRLADNNLKEPIKGADLLIEGTITQFEMGKSEDGQTQPPRIVLILNVIDIKTGRKLISQNVEGKGKPMEKAIKIAIEESAKVIVAKTPAEYYRVSSTLTKSPPSPPKESPKPPKTQPEITSLPPSPPPGKSEPPLRVIQVIWPYVNLRDGPGMSYKNLGNIKKGTSLALLEDRGDWLRVRLQDGKEVWVSKEATTLTQKPQPPPSRTPAPTSAPEQPKPM